MKKIIVKQTKANGCIVCVRAHTHTHPPQVSWNIVDCVPQCPSLPGVTQRGLVGLGMRHREKEPLVVGLLRCMIRENHDVLACSRAGAQAFLSDVTKP